MEFRPCIDIHNGKVKQIVGSSLVDEGNQAKENFVATKSAADYARLYQSLGLRGGHIILLNKSDSEYFQASKEEGLSALRAYPGGMQIGGGITAKNASEYIEAGASHVIVTSYVFSDGRVDFDRLHKLVEAVGADHIVLDLSCRRKGDDYYIVTDRWQKFTDEIVDRDTLDRLSKYCSEFLIHAVDVEGKNQGIENDLVNILSTWTKKPITYAGGVHAYEDVSILKDVGKGNINVTVGSALDIFGGTLDMKEIIKLVK